MIKQYHNFKIIISKREGQLFATLGEAPGGHHLEKDILISLPNDRIHWIEACQGKKKRKELVEIGQRLFGSILKEDLLEEWLACLSETDDETGLRLCISYEPGTMVNVPLELLYKRREPTEFLALNTKTPLVRAPRHGGAVKDRKVTWPLRMLVVIANPKLYSEAADPYDLQTMLEGALSDLLDQKKLLIDYLGLPNGPSATPRTLHHILTPQVEYPYDIVHFIGHGNKPDPDDSDPEGSLVMIDQENERSQSIYSSDVAAILADSGVRFVVLQACEGAQDGTQGVFQGVAQRIVAQGVPAVLAMQCRIDKDVASYFCQELFDFWLNGGISPIELALTKSRQALHREFKDRTAAWLTPVLFIRENSARILSVDRDKRPFNRQLKMGVVLYEKGEYEKAIAELELAYNMAPAPDQQKVSPALSRALVAQAQVTDSAKDEEVALSLCEYALRVYPEGNTAKVLKETILSRRHKVEKGKEKPDPSNRRPNSPTWHPGKILNGKYEIESLASVTARCEVYRGSELDGPHRQVAIKRITEKSLNDEFTQKRFEREIDILQHLSDRTVLSYLYDGEQDGVRYFVTPFAQRGSLKDYIETKSDKKLHPAEALAIAKAICQSIDFVHHEQIIHRDIKPGNILIFSQEDKSPIKLADFSIASGSKKWPTDGLTTHEEVEFLGTDGFAAPEVKLCNDFSRYQSDLYSWGVVFFEMLTGKIFTKTSTGIFHYLPGDAGNDTPSSFFASHGVPKEFIPILQKALKKSPDHRYQTVREILDDLEQLESFILESIKQCLKQGRKHAKGSNWTAANREFRQGLELCQWSDESTDLKSQLEEGYLFVHGNLGMTKEDWDASIEAFEELSELNSRYLGHDIPSLLQQSQSGQQYLHKYHLALQLLDEEQWTAILRQTEGMNPGFTGADGDKSIGDIQKQALYYQAQKLLADNPKQAYHLLYRIWEQDAHYENVVELCAKLAYQSSTLASTPNELSDRVTWLEKTVNIDPDYQNGYAQAELDKARYEWAVQLSSSEDEQKAIEQFERIANPEKFPTAGLILANLYEKQGDKALRKLHIFKAFWYWAKCLYNHYKLPKPY